MAKALAWVAAALLLLGGVVMALAYARTDTYLGRWFAWRASDVGDAERFHSRPIASSPSPWHLPVSASGSGAALSSTVRTTWRGAERSEELGALLERTGTLAFVVVRGGEVELEWYEGGRSRADPVTSFSVAKSVTALLLMAAVDEGHIGSLDDPVTAYLPELSGVDARYDDLTLRHLAN